MKSKKAQGLPITTIIIAVLALIVLVVIVLIFIGGASKFSEGLADCKNKGGTKCANASLEQPCADNEIPVAGICKKGEVCCIPIS